MKEYLMEEICGFAPADEKTIYGDNLISVKSIRQHSTGVETSKLVLQECRVLFTSHPS